MVVDQHETVAGWQRAVGLEDQLVAPGGDLLADVEKLVVLGHAVSFAEFGLSEKVQKPGEPGLAGVTGVVGDPPGLRRELAGRVYGTGVFEQPQRSDEKARKFTAELIGR